MNYPKLIKEFTALANEYCSWAHEKPNPEEEELFYLLNFLPHLYYLAIQLPECQPTDLLYTEELNIQNYGEIHKLFSKLPFQYYNEIYNPFDFEEQPVTGDLADDLTDIYKDLKDGLRYIEKGSEVDAVFFWKNSFGFHWGQHLVAALNALHRYSTK